MLVRRLRGQGGIVRILATVEAVHDRYGTRPHAVAGGATLTTVVEARILAQPAAVVGPDGSMLWAFSPQLKRRPTTSTAFWKVPAPPRPLPGRSLYAAVDGFSYYHWLLGTLPKLLLARQAGMLPESFDRVIVNPRHKGRETFQTASLAALGIPAEKTFWIDRGMHVVCDELTMPSEPANKEQTATLPWARELLRATFLPLALASTAGGKGPERLYVSRAGAKRRRLVNEPEILAALTRRGFAMVVLEELPWLTQLRWFHEAREVVGLHGAGLSNLVFSEPGTRVVEIVPEAWRNPCFAHLAGASGLTYASVSGRRSGPKTGFAADVAVDLKGLLSKITV